MDKVLLKWKMIFVFSPKKWAKKILQKIKIYAIIDSLSKKILSQIINE